MYATWKHTPKIYLTRDHQSMMIYMNIGNEFQHAKRQTHSAASDLFKDRGKFQNGWPQTVQLSSKEATKKKITEEQLQTNHARTIEVETSNIRKI